MAILKYANQSGVVYAYESISEWDSQKKQSRSKRKCLGRVDPETGDIIPTSGKRGRPPKDGNINAKKDAKIPNKSSSEEKLKKLIEDNMELKSQNELLVRENKKLRSVIEKISSEISDIQ